MDEAFTVRPVTCIKRINRVNYDFMTSVAFLNKTHTIPQTRNYSHFHPSSLFNLFRSIFHNTKCTFNKIQLEFIKIRYAALKKSLPLGKIVSKTQSKQNKKYSAIYRGHKDDKLL